MTGKGNPDDANKSASQLMQQGLKADQIAVTNNKARNPQNPWRSSLGNGPQTGNRVEAAYGAPTPTQFGQWERSAYLNTGTVPAGSKLTVQQLQDKYGAPHSGGNVPPNSPTAV
jgi:hypothetical protein